jgi:hypothetical protein
VVTPALTLPRCPFAIRDRKFFKAALVTIELTTREELISTLHLAAELEHNLMYQYLFAAYTMKRATGEGLTEVQLEKTHLGRTRDGRHAPGDVPHGAGAQSSVRHRRHAPFPTPKLFTGPISK